jgi:dipeptidyl aminopeptidase/acylaminoacyl peptidase
MKLKHIVTSLCLFAISAFFVNADVKPVEQISLENFARKYQFLDIKISPGGQFIAATSQEESGNVSLTVIEIASNKVLSNQHLSGKDTIRGFYWANDDRIVFEVARIVGALDMPSFAGELFAVNADGSKPITLTGPRAKNKEYSFSSIAHLLPDEDNYILVNSSPYSRTAPYMHLRKVNIYNGRVSPVTRMPIKSSSESAASLILDNNGDARIVIGSNPEKDDELILLYRDTAKDDWRELSKSSIDGRYFTPFAFLADNKTVVGISNTETKTAAVTLYDTTTMQQTVIAEHPAVDLEPVLNLVKGVPSSVIGASYNYESSEIIIFDDAQDNFSQTLRSLTATFPSRNIAISSVTKDEKLMVVAVSGQDGGKEFYIYNTAEKKLSYLLNAAPWLNRELVPDTQGITYKSRDGLTLHAVLTLPKNTSAKNLPLIMLPHGGPHGIRDYVGYNSDAKVLASRGYAVLQPNFRGSGGFGLDFLQAGYRNWGSTMIDDMTDGVLHLAQQGLINKDRVCTYGGSYGGYAALMSAIREPDLYKCVVGFVGVYDLNLMYTDGDIPERQSGIRYLEKVIGKDKIQLDLHSPLKQLDKLKAPVFIIHGGEDQRVPIIHANRLKEELEKRGHPYQWLVKEKEGHGFFKPENNVERWQKMLAFFDKYIGAGAN